MSQKSFTTTTSFIISSNESLNKPPLSSSRSTSSGSSSNDIMTAGDYIHSPRYFTTLNSVTNKMMRNQNNPLVHSNLNSEPQISMYGSLMQHEHDVSLSNNQSPLFDGQSNLNSSNGTPHRVPPLQYDSYSNHYNNNQNYHLQSPDLESRLISSNRVVVDRNNEQFSTTKPYKLRDSFEPSPKTQPVILGANTLMTSRNTNDSLESNLSTPEKNGQDSLKHTSPSINSFQSNHSSVPARNQRSSLVKQDVTNAQSNLLMPLDVKSMLLHGVTGDEVVRSWLSSLKCDDYAKNFIDHGYDLPMITKMTPQDLTAIGCKSPAVRKKLLTEIKKLNIDDGIPDNRANNLSHWLELLKLSEYYDKLCYEGYDTVDRVCELTWEDLEDIGVHKLGHQKRLLLGIERIKKLDKQLEERHDYSIYDVHPNHRISLNPNYDRRYSTLNRSNIRSGFFQIRPGANLDHRGLPVATVVPALRHVTRSIANLDISDQAVSNAESQTSNQLGLTAITANVSDNRLSTSELGHQTQTASRMNDHENGPKLKELTAATTTTSSSLSAATATTIKRIHPPMPPVRSNSLKIGCQILTTNTNNASSIYGTNYNAVQSSVTGNYVPLTGSTSFLRTPKLGTLTMTTNKMLVQGGHIQSVPICANGQATTLRSMTPLREAPAIPISQSQPPCIPEKIEEEVVHPSIPPPPPPVPSTMSLNSFTPATGCTNALISPSSISHQLASADEFPPPPPSQ